MELESQRLRFRKYNDRDLDFLNSLLSDPDMVKYIGTGNVKDRQGAKDFLEWIYSTYKASSCYGLRILENKETNEPIGHAGLVPQLINEEEELEVGYWVSRTYWGQGYATEAAIALKHYAKHDMEQGRLICLIQPENIASKRVAKKIGMFMEEEIVLGGQKVHIYRDH